MRDNMREFEEWFEKEMSGEGHVEYHIAKEAWQAAQAELLARVPSEDSQLLLEAKQVIEGVLTYDPMVDCYKLKQDFAYHLKPLFCKLRDRIKGPG